MDEFVKEVTTKSVVKVIDGRGPDYLNMSVNPHRNGDTIELVIGAKWDDACGAYLSKKALQSLVNILQEVHDAMTER